MGRIRRKSKTASSFSWVKGQQYTIGIGGLSEIDNSGKRVIHSSPRKNSKRSYRVETPTKN